MAGNNDNGWSIGDDWESLSYENRQQYDSRDLFQKDYAGIAASRILADNHDELMNEQQQQQEVNEEDEWIQNAIEDIILTPLSPVPLYDTAVDLLEKDKVEPEDQVGNEIAMFIRCNESPDDLLIGQGRALAELSPEERYNASQLCFWNATTNQWEATLFLRTAVEIVFSKHAKATTTTTDKNSNSTTDLWMDAAAVAAWMTKSLNERTGSSIGVYDRSVTSTVSKYSVYPTGKIPLSGFQQLYLDAVTGGSGQKKTIAQLNQFRKKDIHGVFRDFLNHGIKSPIEKAHEKRLKDQNMIQTSKKEDTGVLANDHFVDECEIMEWNEKLDDVVFSKDKISLGTTTENNKYIKRSSHESVTLAFDKQTPLYLKDGEFVFIDEESCIGCKQCVNTAPSSFLMLESGRARAFAQRNAPDVAMGVSTCPVSCMHMVSFQELKELEKVRDKGDGRTDHQHMGHRTGHTPLHVARRSSDGNHKSSWYHYLKNKCRMSSQCPQRGCYDCPSFSKPGQNPHFQKRLKQAYRIRAKHFMDQGHADPWRKQADV